MTQRTETQRTWLQGSTLSVGVLLVLALFVMANYLASRHYKRFDMTSSKLYTLSQKSLNVVQDLDRDIEMVIFLSPNSELYGAADELLSRYEAANPARIKKRIIDPARNMLEARALVERHGIERDNVIVIASDDDRRVLNEFELVEYDTSGAQFGQPPTLKAFKGEQLITSAVLELMEANKPKILFTTGHGEASIDAGDPRSLNQARDLLGKDNFDLQTWSSLGQSEVPAGVDLVVVAGPLSNFLPPELDLFTRYLEGGGRMLLLLDPVVDETGRSQDLGLVEWLLRYGVQLRPDVVIDPAQQLPFYGPETIYTDSYDLHPIVESLDQTRTPVLLSLARSVSRASDAPVEADIVELIRTGNEAWGETGLERLDQGIEPDGDDLLGPVSLGVAVSIAVADGPELADATAGVPEGLEASLDGGENTEDEESSGTREARLVIIGDLDFATDTQVINAGNSTLLLNAFNWLVQRDQLIAIEPRRPEETKLSLSSSEMTTIYFLVLGVMPALAIVCGVWVFYQRRR